MQSSYMPLKKDQTADGRLLTELDNFFFTNSFAPLSLVMSHDSCFSGDKVSVAWKQTVKVTPMLRMKVAGDGDDAMHVPLEEELWPTIAIKKVDADDDVAHEAQKELQCANMSILGDTAKQRLPGFAAYIIGPNRGALVLANPHHFIDGAGYGALVAKLMMYCKTPQALWSPLDMLSCQRVPSFRDMALKRHVGIEDPPIEPLPARIDPDNFSFSDYNPFVPLPDQPSLCGFEGNFAPINTQHMKQVREQLRSQGLTITTALTALAAKTFAMLISENCEEVLKKKVITVLPCDARQTFSEKKAMELSFPVVANYAFIVHSQFDISDAVQDSIFSLASKIKNQKDEVTKDPELLRKEILGQYCTPPLPVYVGVSSVNVEYTNIAILGLDNVGLHSRILYGPIPRVWFYVLTYCDQTTLAADIMLPIHGLTPEKVLETVETAACGTCFEGLFGLSKN